MDELEQSARTLLMGIGVDPDEPRLPDGRAPWRELIDSARALLAAGYDPKIPLS